MGQAPSSTDIHLPYSLAGQSAGFTPPRTIAPVIAPHKLASMVTYLVSLFDKEPGQCNFRTKTAKIINAVPLAGTLLASALETASEIAQKEAKFSHTPTFGPVHYLQVVIDFVQHTLTSSNWLQHKSITGVLDTDTTNNRLYRFRWRLAQPQEQDDGMLSAISAHDGKETINKVQKNLTIAEFKKLSQEHQEDILFYVLDCNSTTLSQTLITDIDIAIKRLRIGDNSTAVDRGIHELLQVYNTMSIKDKRKATPLDFKSMEPVDKLKTLNLIREIAEQLPPPDKKLLSQYARYSTSEQIQNLKESEKEPFEKQIISGFNRLTHYSQCRFNDFSYDQLSLLPPERNEQLLCLGFALVAQNGTAAARVRFAHIFAQRHRLQEPDVQAIILKTLRCYLTAFEKTLLMTALFSHSSVVQVTPKELLLLIAEVEKVLLISSHRDPQEVSEFQEQFERLRTYRPSQQKQTVQAETAIDMAKIYRLIGPHVVSSDEPLTPCAHNLLQSIGIDLPATCTLTSTAANILKILPYCKGFIDRHCLMSKPASSALHVNAESWASWLSEPIPEGFYQLEVCRKKAKEAMEAQKVVSKLTDTFNELFKKVPLRIASDAISSILSTAQVRFENDQRTFSIQLNELEANLKANYPTLSDLYFQSQQACLLPFIVKRLLPNVLDTVRALEPKKGGINKARLTGFEKLTKAQVAHLTDIALRSSIILAHEKEALLSKSPVPKATLANIILQILDRMHPAELVVLSPSSYFALDSTMQQRIKAVLHRHSNETDSAHFKKLSKKKQYEIDCLTVREYNALSKEARENILHALVKSKAYKSFVDTDFERLVRLYNLLPNELRYDVESPTVAHYHRLSFKDQTKLRLSVATSHEYYSQLALPTIEEKIAFAHDMTYQMAPDWEHVQFKKLKNSKSPQFDLLLLIYGSLQPQDKCLITPSKPDLQVLCNKIIEDECTRLELRQKARTRRMNTLLNQVVPVLCQQIDATQALQTSLQEAIHSKKAVALSLQEAMDTLKQHAGQVRAQYNKLIQEIAHKEKGIQLAVTQLKKLKAKKERITKKIAALGLVQKERSILLSCLEQLVGKPPMQIDDETSPQLDIDIQPLLNDIIQAIQEALLTNLERYKSSFREFKRQVQQARTFLDELSGSLEAFQPLRSQFEERLSALEQKEQQELLRAQERLAQLANRQASFTKE